MKITDIFGVEKLLETISKAVGGVSAPYLKRKETAVEADRIKTIAQAMRESSAVGEIRYTDGKISIVSSGDGQTKLAAGAPIEQRAADRQAYQEVRRQSNIERVTGFAAEELKREESVDDKPVDEDWAVRLLKIAEEVSDERMQALWGKILAGEVKSPGSYSLRTLEILRNLSKEEAETFLKFARLSIILPDTAFVINFENEKPYQEKYKLILDERILLGTLGLLVERNLLVNVRESDAGEVVFRLGTDCVIVNAQKGTALRGIPAFVFTKSGQELLKLVTYTPKLDYIQLLASKVIDEGVRVCYAEFLGEEDGAICYSNPIEVPGIRKKAK